MPIVEQQIPIPNDPVKLIELGVKVYAKHCIMGDKSPLLALQSNSWEENGPEVNNALRLHQFMEENRNHIQEYMCRLDELITKIKASIQASLNLLSVIYHNNTIELGFWGFDVDE